MSLNSLTVVFLLIVHIHCNDLFLGYPDLSSTLIYSKVHQENPAFWVRSETFTVNCTKSEVINAIKIQDLRDDKYGEVYIKDGGIGQKFVTIELDSPSIFRGYNFLVEVYAIEANFFFDNHGK
ncbi:unnamed protein product, partial [Brenthis ino]